MLRERAAPQSEVIRVIFWRVAHGMQSGCKSLWLRGTETHSEPSRSRRWSTKAPLSTLHLKAAQTFIRNG